MLQRNQIARALIYRKPRFCFAVILHLLERDNQSSATAKPVVEDQFLLLKAVGAKTLNKSRADQLSMFIAVAMQNRLSSAMPLEYDYASR